MFHSFFSSTFEEGTKKKSPYRQTTWNDCYNFDRKEGEKNARTFVTAWETQQQSLKWLRIQDFYIFASDSRWMYPMQEEADDEATKMTHRLRWRVVWPDECKLVTAKNAWFFLNNLNPVGHKH